MKLRCARTAEPATDDHRFRRRVQPCHKRQPQTRLDAFSNLSNIPHQMAGKAYSRGGSFSMQIKVEADSSLRVPAGERQARGVSISVFKGQYSTPSPSSRAFFFRVEDCRNSSNITTPPSEQCKPTTTRWGLYKRKACSDGGDEEREKQEIIGGQSRQQDYLRLRCLRVGFTLATVEFLKIHHEYYNYNYDKN